MKKFEIPELNIIIFQNDDIITKSIGDDDDRSDFIDEDL